MYRHAKNEIIEAADLVTEMKEIKHPFKSGIKAKQCMNNGVPVLCNDLPENNNVVMYLNRLSDYFFVLARFYNKNKNIIENTWQR